VDQEVRQVEQEIARWEEKTGYGLETVVNADPMMRFDDLSEDNRREANELSERLKLARERRAEQ
jgi:hypothetical protein